MVRLLLEAEADKNAVKQDGTTALILAARNGHLEVLLDAGADKNAAKQSGAGNLLHACSSE